MVSVGAWLGVRAMELDGPLETVEAVEVAGVVVVTPDGTIKVLE